MDIFVDPFLLSHILFSFYPSPPPCLSSCCSSNPILILCSSFLSPSFLHPSSPLPLSSLQCLQMIYARKMRDMTCHIRYINTTRGSSSQGSDRVRSSLSIPEGIDFPLPVAIRYTRVCREESWLVVHVATI